MTQYTAILILDVSVQQEKESRKCTSFDVTNTKHHMLREFFELSIRNEQTDFGRYNKI